jgi:hypothetical protein
MVKPAWSFKLNVLQIVESFLFGKSRSKQGTRRAMKVAPPEHSRSVAPPLLRERDL